MRRPSRPQRRARCGSPHRIRASACCRSSLQVRRVGLVVETVDCPAPQRKPAPVQHPGRELLVLYEGRQLSHEAASMRRDLPHSQRAVFGRRSRSLVHVLDRWPRRSIIAPHDSKIDSTRTNPGTPELATNSIAGALPSDIVMSLIRRSISAFSNAVLLLFGSKPRAPLAGRARCISANRPVSSVNGERAIPTQAEII